MPAPSISETNEIHGEPNGEPMGLGFWPAEDKITRWLGIERERMSPGDGWTSALERADFPVIRQTAVTRSAQAYQAADG